MGHISPIWVPWVNLVPFESHLSRVWPGTLPKRKVGYFPRVLSSPPLFAAYYAQLERRRGREKRSVHSCFFSSPKLRNICTGWRKKHWQKVKWMASWGSGKASDIVGICAIAFASPCSALREFRRGQRLRECIPQVSQFFVAQHQKYTTFLRKTYYMWLETEGVSGRGHRRHHHSYSEVQVFWQRLLWQSKYNCLLQQWVIVTLLSISDTVVAVTVLHCTIFSQPVM